MSASLSGVMLSIGVTRPERRFPDELAGHVGALSRRQVWEREALRDHPVSTFAALADVFLSGAGS